MHLLFAVLKSTAQKLKSCFGFSTSRKLRYVVVTASTSDDLGEKVTTLLNHPSKVYDVVGPASLTTYQFLGDVNFSFMQSLIEYSDE